MYQMHAPCRSMPYLTAPGVALLQAEEAAREQAAQSLKALQGEFEEAKVRGS